MPTIMVVRFAAGCLVGASAQLVADVMLGASVGEDLTIRAVSAGEDRVEAVEDS